jgi:hypothetical protein
MGMTVRPFRLVELEYHTREGPDGCRIWTKNALNPFGQPIITRAGRQASVIQHYMEAKGFPRGLRVTRFCDTPGCVAPEHHWWPGKRFKRGVE